MVELVLFVGGMLMAWVVAGLFCAERQRRLNALQNQIALERAAAAAAAAEAVKRKRRAAMSVIQSEAPTAKAA